MKLKVRRKSDIRIMATSATVDFKAGSTDVPVLKVLHEDIIVLEY